MLGAGRACTSSQPPHHLAGPPPPLAVRWSVHSDPKTWGNGANSWDREVLEKKEAGREVGVAGAAGGLGWGGSCSF